MTRGPDRSVRADRPASPRNGSRLTGAALHRPARYPRRSGVDYNDVCVDGRAFAPVAGTSEIVAAPAAGPHTLGVVAVEPGPETAAGLATRRFVVR
jgi:hypothetical protein